MALSKPNLLAVSALAGVVVLGAAWFMTRDDTHATGASAEMGKAGGPGAPGAGAPGGRGPGGPGGMRGGGRPSAVVAVPAAQREFSIKIEALGTLEPREKVDLTANTPDRVTGVFFEDGQRVKKGTVLVTLVNDEERALLESSQATLDDATRNFQRNERLYKENAVSTLEYQRSQRDRDAAAGTVRSLQARLADRVVRAPFNGILGFRMISNGAYVSPGQVVATLIDDSEMRLEFTVPSISLSQLKQGLIINAKTDDRPGEVFSGALTSVDNAIDPVTRSVRARATLPNKDARLRAGMFMSVDVGTLPRTALSVPEIAILAEGPKTFVFVVDNAAKPATARKQEIKLGIREKGVVEVVSGLNPGDEVVTDGLLKIRPGGAIVVEREPPPAGGAPVGGAVLAGAAGSSDAVGMRQ